MKSIQYLKSNQAIKLKKIDEIEELYSEKIISLIYTMILEQSWNEREEEIINLVYAALEEIFVQTLEWLSDCYGIKENPEHFISDFKNLTYHKDGMDIEQRIKKYITKYRQAGLENDRMMIAYEMSRIMKTEGRTLFFNLTKQKIKNAKPGAVWVADIWGSDECKGGCSMYYGEAIPESEVIAEPPFHQFCGCNIFWYPVEQDDFVNL